MDPVALLLAVLTTPAFVWLVSRPILRGKFRNLISTKHDGWALIAAAYTQGCRLIFDIPVDLEASYEVDANLRPAACVVASA